MSWWCAGFKAARRREILSLRRNPHRPAGTSKLAVKTGVEWIAGGGGKLNAETTFVAIRPQSLPGDSVRIVAERPDGSVEPLIWFYRYDPKFARTYYFRKPLKLPAGTKIVASIPGATVALLRPVR